MDMVIEGYPEYAETGNYWYFRWHLKIQYGDVDKTIRTLPVGPFPSKDEAYAHALASEDTVIATITEASKEIMPVDFVEVERFELPGSSTRGRGN